MKFPRVDTDSWFYRNCKQQRRREAKICQVCPFRAGIEQQEANKNSAREIARFEKAEKHRKAVEDIIMQETEITKRYKEVML